MFFNVCSEDSKVNFLLIFKRTRRDIKQWTRMAFLNYLSLRGMALGTYSIKRDSLFLNCKYIVSLPEPLSTSNPTSTLNYNYLSLCDMALGTYSIKRDSLFLRLSCNHNLIICLCLITSSFRAQIQSFIVLVSYHI